MDTNITFRWNQVKGAEKYFIQLSADPTFKNISISDSTADTLKTITDFSKGQKYYWRVQVKGTAGLGPWSEVWNFITAISLPVKPELVAATPYPNRPGWFTFNWKKAKDADQYLLQTSDDQTFASVLMAASTSDTVKILSGFSEGKTYYWRVQASNVAGTGPWSEVGIFPTSTTDVKEREEIPTEYSISQNYPNPFNPTTTIKFALPQAALTKLIIYDLFGREILTVINKEIQAGYHQIDFDASKLPSGVYFYRIQSGKFIHTKKMILIK